MSKLYVDKSIEIQASAARVWEILTLPGRTRDWASEFAAGGPRLHLESTWQLGSPVLWKDEKGATVVEGEITACVVHSLLRFSVFDVNGPRPMAGSEDGITFKLTERSDRTVLWVSQGDFSAMPDGPKYRDLSEEVWNRALPRIKRVAEGR